MSYFAVLCFKRSATLNKCWLDRCLKRYLTYQTRTYATGISNHHKNYVAKREHLSRRKALRLQVLQDIKQTKRKVEEIIEKENIWTVPNLLCMARIVTSPYLSYLILSQDYQIALWLLIIAGLSDLADGWIARTWTSQASKLGSFLDPVADKLLKTLARYFDPTHATAQLAPTYISKLNTGIQLSFIAGTLAAPVFHFVNHPVLEALCYVTAVTTLAGGISYLISKNTYKFLKRKTLKKPPT
ncbi:probable cardiolipin synthase (CMP-forming) isoform X2 [Ceratina calcarata]|uniref:cardiolipin synthase (CMP-forming) n=1 Tax=Ceratina calcarata TaxID=156304 RepID=A0AAJ7WC24_9HYME|nr:probable cardiolipin synthase (CMP-forming) isoform X2 [Ceratina calcarata]